MVASAKDRNRSNLPAVNGDVVHMPVTINTEDKQMIWDFVVADMQHRKLWHQSFTFVVAELVQTTVMLNENRLLLEDEGTVLERYNKDGDPTGNFYENPRFRIVVALQDKMRVWMEKLGLSPRDITFLLHTDPVGDQGPEVITAEDAGAVVYFR